MSRNELRIATRASALARWQADHVAALLTARDPDVQISFVPVTTHADRHLDVPIAEIGGKGVFAKEVQYAVLEGRADVAVHSAKDLTATSSDGLALAAVPERGDSRDALAGASLDGLPPGAVVGTGSARRRVQLAGLRDDLEIVGLRGNIATRLGRVEDGTMAAIVVAAAALERLDLLARAGQIFGVDEMIPQVAQGALGVECRSDDDATIDRLARIQDPPSRLRVDAERAFLARLGGDCDLPAGAHATVDDGGLQITGILASESQGTPQRATVRDESTSAGALRVGTALAEQLLALVGPAS
ncbi:MAG TPA: hydroxymethylbilane synthase [Acidimicrobiales bacterium]|nr:hydroxymethylbilane synthase [Acidimicrobiales bacterium]